MSYPQPKLPSSNVLIEKHSKARYIVCPQFLREFCDKHARDQVRRYK